MSNPTVTRRAISLNWRSRTRATGSSVSVSDEDTSVDLPLVHLLGGSEQPGWLFFDPDADYPGTGYIFRRDGFAPIIVAVDDPNISGLAGFLNVMQALLGEPDALGLGGMLDGSLASIQNNETIVIHIRDQRSGGVQGGAYHDLDITDEGVGLDLSSINGLPDFSSPSSDTDFDYIEIFAADSPDDEYRAFRFASTAIHEILHRQQPHQYNVRIGADAGIAGLIAEFTIDEIVDDPVYAQTRDILGELYRNGHLLNNDKMFGDPGAITVEQLVSNLRQNDITRLVD